MVCALVNAEYLDSDALSRHEARTVLRVQRLSRLVNTRERHATTLHCTHHQQNKTIFY